MMNWIIGTAHAAETGGKTLFPPFDSSTFAGQLFWLAAVFGIIYLMVSRVALPRLDSILSVRAGRISADLDAAAQAQKKAEDAAKGYEQALAQAKASAQGIAIEARDKAAKASDAERKTVEAGLAQKLAGAEAKIADTKRAAMANVDSIARDAAQAIVQQITGKAPLSGVLDAAFGALRKH